MHNFWNHLIETTSTKTGSLLMRDKGTYEVLLRIRDRKEGFSLYTIDDGSESSHASGPIERPNDSRPENEKLVTGFRTRYMRVHLHGTKLPKDYAVVIRLPTNEVSRRLIAKRKSRLKRQYDTKDDENSDDETEARVEQEIQEQDLDTNTNDVGRSDTPKMATHLGVVGGRAPRAAKG